MSEVEKIVIEEEEEEDLPDIRKKQKTYSYTGNGKVKVVKRQWVNKTDRQERCMDLMAFLDSKEEWRTQMPSVSKIVKEFNEKMQYDRPVSTSMVYKNVVKYCEQHNIPRKKRVQKSSE